MDSHAKKKKKKKKERKNLDFYLIPPTNIFLKWNKDFKCKIRNYKTPRRKHKKNRFNMSIGKVFFFFNMTPKTQSTK